MHTKHLLPLIAFLITTTIHAQTTQHGLRLPTGFEVHEYAGSQLANDIYTLTIDPKGRVVVAGRGYIRILVDDNHDGTADRALPFADTPKDGAMGMLWEGDTLYVTGDGGLRRFRDKDGDDRADGPSEVIRRLKTGGEHAAHAIRRGPDGWLYVLCGNHTGIDKSFVQLRDSPVEEPVAGCVVRFSPDLKKSDVFAHGFRNAYGMDFNSDGELFTYDSDNERCVSLPWYEYTRFYHVRPGRFYGWLSPQRASFWRMPPYSMFVVAPLAYLDRGSPTGVACYRHVQFPKKYQGGLFACDWTFGRVWFLQLRKAGATYTCKKELFVQAVGDNGFAPTGIVVHPKTGDMYVAIGGRGTRGAIYRIRYKHARNIDPAKVAALQPRRRPRSLATPRNYKLKNVGEFAWRNVTAGKGLKRIDALSVELGDFVSPKARNSVWEGYTLRAKKKGSRIFQKQLNLELARMRQAFPTGHADLDREISRTLAALQWNDSTLLTTVSAHLAKTKHPVEQIHYLIVLARLRGQRTDKIRQTITTTLLGLDQRLAQQKLHTDRHWPLRISEMYRELARLDAKLNDSLLSHKDFGRPAHALFATTKGFDRKQAALRFLQRARHADKAGEDYAWNTQTVQLLDQLPATQSLPVLRKLWNNAGLQSAILPMLARNPDKQDRDKFLEGLKSARLATVHLSLKALKKLPPSGKPQELLSLLLAMKRFPAKQAKALHQDIAAYLEQHTKQKHGTDVKAWTKWFRQTHPTLAERLTNPDGVDLQKWSKRLTRLDWSKGHAATGQKIFTKAGCLACHSGRQALGPDLRGITKRFSRDDLLTAILQPSRDVPPRYQATLLATNAGKVYQGLVIYQATDSVILQTGATDTVRIGGENIAGQYRVGASLMPAGLLDNLSDREIVDLYAYLRSLR